MTERRHKNHWIGSTFVQRMTTKEWKQILLNHEDRIVFRGHITKLIGKNIGSGVIEVSKEGKND